MPITAEMEREQKEETHYLFFGKYKDKKTNGGMIRMEFEVQEPIIVPDGAHQGVIVATEYRTEPYKYTDIIIEMPVGQKHIKVKYGCATPEIMTVKTKLGKLLLGFGINMSTGAKVTPEALIGKACVFMTVTEKSNKGEFVRVVADSVKPLQPEAPSVAPPTPPQ